MRTVLDFFHSPLQSQESQEMPNLILSSNCGGDTTHARLTHKQFSNLVSKKLSTLPSQTAILSTDLSADLSTALKPILQEDLESFDGRVLYIPQKQLDNPVETISISRSSSSDDEKLLTPLILYNPVPIKDPADEAPQPVSWVKPQDGNSHFDVKILENMNSLIVHSEVVGVDQLNLPGHELQSTLGKSFLPLSDKILGDKSNAQWVKSTQVDISSRANQDLEVSPDDRAVLQMPVLIHTQSERERTSDLQVTPQVFNWPVPISADSGSEIIVPSQSFDNKFNSAQQTYQMPVPVPQGEAGNHALETISQNLEVYNPTSDSNLPIIKNPIPESEQPSGDTSETLIVQSIPAFITFHTQDYSHNGLPQNASESIKDVVHDSEAPPSRVTEIHTGVFLEDLSSYPPLRYPVAKEAESDHQKEIEMKSYPSVNDSGSPVTKITSTQVSINKEEEVGGTSFQSDSEVPKASLASSSFSSCFRRVFSCFRSGQNLQSTETSATSEPSTRFSFPSCFAFACARSSRNNS